MCVELTVLQAFRGRLYCLHFPDEETTAAEPGSGRRGPSPPPPLSKMAGALLRMMRAVPASLPWNTATLHSHNLMDDVWGFPNPHTSDLRLWTFSKKSLVQVTVGGNSMVHVCVCVCVHVSTHTCTHSKEAKARLVLAGFLSPKAGQGCRSPSATEHLFYWWV